MTFFYKFFKRPKGGDFIQNFNPRYEGDCDPAYQPLVLPTWQVLTV